MWPFVAAFLHSAGLQDLCRSIHQNSFVRPVNILYVIIVDIFTLHSAGHKHSEVLGSSWPVPLGPMIDLHTA